MWPIQPRLVQQQQQQQQHEFQLQQEEFPSLSAAVSAPKKGQNQSSVSQLLMMITASVVNSTSSSQNVSRTNSIPPSSSTAAVGLAVQHQHQMMASIQQQQQQQHLSSSTPPQQQQQQPSSIQPPSVDSAPVDRFGLMGLLGVIRMTDQDLNTLALGCDLTTLGLNLNSADPLYSTFISPWSEHPTQAPEAPIPQCYTVPAVPDLLSKVSQWSEGTLFYIFYSMPGDALQMLSARELFRRNWRYHQDLKLWLTKDPTTGAPIEKTALYEKGIYIVWDIRLWARVTKELVVVYELLEDLSQSMPAGMTTSVQPPSTDSQLLKHRDSPTMGALFMNTTSNTVAPSTIANTAPTAGTIANNPTQPFLSYGNQQQSQFQQQAQQVGVMGGWPRRQETGLDR